MLSDVTPAMTSRPTGPRDRTARKTDAAAESDRCSDGGTIWRCTRNWPFWPGLRAGEWWVRAVVRTGVLCPSSYGRSWPHLLTCVSGAAKCAATTLTDRGKARGRGVEQGAAVHTKNLARSLELSG